MVAAPRRWLLQAKTLPAPEDMPGATAMLRGLGGQLFGALGRRRGRGRRQGETEGEKEVCSAWRSGVNRTAAAYPPPCGEGRSPERSGGDPGGGRCGLRGASNNP